MNQPIQVSGKRRYEVKIGAGNTARIYVEPGDYKVTGGTRLNLASGYDFSYDDPQKLHLEKCQCANVELTFP
jgi:hypothetical protein